MVLFKIQSGEPKKVDSGFKFKSLEVELCAQTHRFSFFSLCNGMERMGGGKESETNWSFGKLGTKDHKVGT